MSPTTPFGRAPRRPNIDEMVANWSRPAPSPPQLSRREARLQARTRRRVAQSVATVGVVMAVGGFGAAAFGLTPAEVATRQPSHMAASTADIAVVASVTAPESAEEITSTTQRTEVEHEVVKKDDPTLEAGVEKVIAEGENGVTLTSYDVTVVNGKEVARDEMLKVNVSEPVTEVVLVGTKPKVVTPTIPKTSNSGANRAIGRDLAAGRGWTGDEWNCLNALFTRESGWNTYADNPNSSAYGIPQSLPGSKMASAGSDWRTNPSTQITWGLNYIKSRYGTPCGAWAHSERVGWY